MQLMLIPSSRHLPLRPVLFDDNEEVVELVSHYLRAKVDSAEAYSPETIKLYAKQLLYFCEFLAGDDFYGKMSLDHALTTIPGGVIDQYLVHERKRGLEDTTVRGRDVVLKGFFEWLTTAEASYARESSGYANDKLKTRTSKRKMPRFVTSEQVIQLLHGLHHESLRCVVHFMFDTGLRVSEVQRVTKEDIDALDCFPDEVNYLPLLVQGSKGRGGNQIKERYTLISRAVYERIKRFHSTIQYRTAQIAGTKPAFLNTKKGPLTKKAIAKQIGDAAKRAGFAPRTVSPHRLRHGTALSILQGESGQDYLEKLVLIKIQFGHSDIKTAEGYAHLIPMILAKLNALNEDEEVKARFQEAQNIYDETYLPAKFHKERRGRPRKNKQMEIA